MIGTLQGTSEYQGAGLSYTSQNFLPCSLSENVSFEPNRTIALSAQISPITSARSLRSSPLIDFFFTLALIACHATLCADLG